MGSARRRERMGSVRRRVVIPTARRRAVGTQGMMGDTSLVEVSATEEEADREEGPAELYQRCQICNHRLDALQEAQQHCEQVSASASGARNAHMMVCPQRYYDQSCEKACVEIQRNGDHGCGVIEGSQYGDAFARGGV